MMRIREASFILSLFVVLLFALRLDMRAGDFFPIRMLDARMATLSVSVEGENGTLHRPFPYYSPTKGEKLLISFDLLDAMPEEIGYTLSYCDESWHPVSVPHGLAVVGFAEGLLAASQPSVMTQVLYRHYSLKKKFFRRKEGGSFQHLYIVATSVLSHYKLIGAILKQCLAFVKIYFTLHRLVRGVIAFGGIRSHSG